MNEKDKQQMTIKEQDICRNRTKVLRYERKPCILVHARIWKINRSQKTFIIL